MRRFLASIALVLAGASSVAAQGTVMPVIRAPWQNPRTSTPMRLQSLRVDVKIVGHLNVAGRLAASASALYAKNLLTLLEILIDKASKSLAVQWDDEIVKAIALTRDGAVIHPNFQPKNAA